MQSALLQISPDSMGLYIRMMIPSPQRNHLSQRIRKHANKPVESNFILLSFPECKAVISDGSPQESNCHGPHHCKNDCITVQCVYESRNQIQRQIIDPPFSSARFPFQSRKYGMENQVCQEFPDDSVGRSSDSPTRDHHVGLPLHEMILLLLIKIPFQVSCGIMIFF